MATMSEPKAEHKTLVHYLVEAGVAIIELDDPPANTYTFEMMRQLDEAILRARFDDGAHVVVLRGHGEKFFSAGANIAPEQHHSALQVLLLPARQRNAQPPRAYAQAHDRCTQRAHRRWRARDRDGVRPPAREGERGEDRPPGGEPRRAARHGRHAAAGAHRGQDARDRDD